MNTNSRLYRSAGSRIAMHQNYAFSSTPTSMDAVFAAYKNYTYPCRSPEPIVSQSIADSRAHAPCFAPFLHPKPLHSPARI